MLRRILSLFPILILSSSLYSVAVTAGEGFYVGIGGGWAEFKSDVKSQSISPNDDPVGITDLANQGVTKNSGLGEAHAGYKKLFLGDQLVYSLAIEVFAELQDRDLTVNAINEKNRPETEYILTTSSDYTFGISIEPGLFVTNNLMLYLDAGVTYIRLDDIKSSIESDNDGITLPNGSFGSENRFGLRAGVGIEWLLTKQLSLDLSWAIDFYNEFSLNRALTTLPPEHSNYIYEDTTVSNLQNSRFLLAVDYYFSGW